MIASFCWKRLLLQKPRLHPKQGWRRDKRAHFSLDLHVATTTRRKMVGLEPDPFLVDSRNAPADFEVSSAVVYRDVVSVEESKVLVDAIDVKLRRRRYERGHWDAVIIDYKEIEISDEENFPAKHVLQRIRNHLHERHVFLSQQRQEDENYDRSGQRDDFTWLPCHAIDLKKDGQLQAHIDSVRFSGDLVAGLSLLSSSIMRLRPADDVDSVANAGNAAAATSGWVDLFLPPRSLYALTGPSRYRYTHELLPAGSFFSSSNADFGEDEERNSVQVHRDRRLSFIFRDAKKE